MLKGERLTAAAVIPGDSQGHLEQPEQATKPEGVSMATGKPGGLWIQINNKNSWTLLSLFSAKCTFSAMCHN